MSSETGLQQSTSTADGAAALHPAPGVPGRPALYTPAFIAVSLVSLLSFGGNMIIQPILPILVLEVGGSATLVGIVFLAFSVPSVALRPFMGRLSDTWSQRGTLSAGTLGLGVSGFLYLLPSPVTIMLTRLVHGTSWAAFIASSHATMARLAPASRRSEASGIFNLMPGIAQMFMPALGLLLIGATGVAGPFVVSGLCGLAAFAVVRLGPLPRVLPVKRAEGDGFWSSLIERPALLPMTLEFLFTSVSSLFLIYPPVLFASLGLPVESLAAFYLISGGTLVATRLIAGRFVDRLPRHRVIAIGAVTAMVGLVVAIGASSVIVLTIAGSIHAASVAITSPTTMALAIDRADRDRLGAAMATYTIGFQLGLGVGAAVWGIIIDAAGFPAPYIVGLGSLALMLSILTWWRRSSSASGAGP
jgi:MFS family permease